MERHALSCLFALLDVMSVLTAGVMNTNGVPCEFGSTCILLLKKFGPLDKVPLLEDIWFRLAQLFATPVFIDLVWLV